MLRHQLEEFFARPRRRRDRGGFVEPERRSPGAEDADDKGDDTDDRGVGATRQGATPGDGL
ncbi:hypothetical protein [Williamsia limnetica]|uniref:hypothetical protein n=1 Tax=Williamsia limnetica TaxID=882452 RepID=UPI000D7C7918|nr:hypothetical protein [Williamsia limnetica]